MMGSSGSYPRGIRKSVVITYEFPRRLISVNPHNNTLHLHSMGLTISLSGKRICDSLSIRVSEISIYYGNRRLVPTLGKHLFTLHFVKA